MRSIESNLGGWEDAELVHFESDGSTAEVHIRLWNARTAVLRFSDVILIRYDSLDVIADVVEVTEPSEAIHHALARTYDPAPPKDHPFHEYALVDIDGARGLVVVAAELRLEAEEK